MRKKGAMYAYGEALSSKRQSRLRHAWRPGDMAFGSRRPGREP